MRQPTGDDTLAGYVRQSIADIVPTATLRAAPINAEYNKLRDAFAVSSGHKHDGSTGEGGYIPLIGDVDALNKVVIDTSNNRVGVFVEVSSAAVEQVRFQDGVIVPVTTNDIDLGSSSAKFKDLHLQGTATIATVDINAGNIDGTILGASTPTTATFTSATLNNNLTVTGTSTLVGTTTITSVDLNSGAIDNAVIGSATPVAGTFTTLNANTSLVAATADINGGTLDGATVGASVPSTGAFTTLTASGTSTLTTVDINGGNIDGTVIGASTASTGSFTTLSTSGQATLATADINGGSIDGSTIGASSASTGAFTTLTASGGITGNITGNVTGNTAGVHTGNVTGNVTGNLTGNVTAGSGTSTFTNLVVNGNLNMNAGTSATITNLTAPSSDLDAATKKYVDDEISTLVGDAGAGLDTLGELADALNDDDAFSTTVTNSIATKLPKAGGTMTGAIAMSTNKITGAGDPTSAQDVATKAYTDTQRDTRVAKTGDTMSGALAMGNNKITGLATPTAGTDVTNKTYVDGVLGSATVAATSATNAATSATNAATSATNASNSATSAATSATNAASSYDNFDDRYLGAKSSAPTVDNDGDALITGALYFNSTSNIMYVYGGSGWQAAGSSVNGTSERTTYTATAGQTVFAATYDTGYIDVYLNGVKLLVGTDFTATNGTSITLASGASVNDVVDIVAYGTFVLADHYTKTASDARYVNVAGDTMSGNLNVTGRTTTDNATVGSGTASTYVDLTVNGASTANYGPIIELQSAGTAFGKISNYGRVQGGTSTDMFVTTATTNSLMLGTNNTERMRIDSSGRVGIGASNNSSYDSNAQNLLLASSGNTGMTIRSAGAAPHAMIHFADGTTDNNTKRAGRIIYQHDGDNLTIHTANTERMRFDGSGNVGIGQTPSATSSYMVALQVGEQANLYGHVDGTGAGSATYLSNNITHNSGEKYINSDAGSLYNQSSGSHKWYTYPSGTAGATATASERMRINSSGNVGIGTSSISSSDKLSVVGGKIRASQSIAQSGNSLDNATYSGITINNSNDANGDLAGIAMYPTSQYTAAAGLFGVRESQTAAGLSFWTGSNTGAERMRIDSSGNVTVGKTSVDTDTTGIELRANNLLASTRASAECLFLNRKTSDGDIAKFAKDGTTVGSIGVNGSYPYIGSHGTSGKGIKITDALLPATNSGAFNDANVNLGASNVRWKDLYLSGGVYLGGTGSANKLSDYEEGTFTPQWDGYAPANSQGRYTKIGNQVIVHAHLVTSTAADYSGVKINNLPFTSSNVAGVGAGMTWCDNTYFYDFVTHTRVYPASTQCVLNLVHNGSLQAMEYVGRTPQIGGSGTFRWTIIYQTDA